MMKRLYGQKDAAQMDSGHEGSSSDVSTKKVLGFYCMILPNMLSFRSSQSQQKKYVFVFRIDSPLSRAVCQQYHL